MDIFKILFGGAKQQLKKTCVLLPFVRKMILKELGVEKLARGRRYAIGQSGSFTVIRTGIGAVSLGDAVLYLKETPCQNIILFGACGLISRQDDMGIGSLVLPIKCYAEESFSRMLLRAGEVGKAFYPDQKLSRLFLHAGQSLVPREVTGLSVGSLKLMEERLDFLRRKEIEVVDMECAALFAAAEYIGRKSLALLYVTDIVGPQPYYRSLDDSERGNLTLNIQVAAGELCAFIDEKLNGCSG